VYRRKKEEKANRTKNFLMLMFLCIKKLIVNGGDINQRFVNGLSLMVIVTLIPRNFLKKDQKNYIRTN
jgi:hypothetical protein